MLPTFFIIGATKAGTTSLSKYLGLHPQIHMAPWKEPHFFVQPGDGLLTISHRIATLKEYERLFESALGVRGEASTSYSHYPARGGVAERIREHVPDARFVYLVRDPIDRVVSHYVHQVAWEAERRPIDEAVGDLKHPHNVYVCASRYATQIERYLALFPEENFLVVDNNDLRREQARSLTEIFRFLGVDPTIAPGDFGREWNTADEQRLYPHLYSRLRHQGPLRRLPAPLRGRLQRLAGRAERGLWRPVEKPEPSDVLRARLVEVFTDEVSRLRSLTGKAFGTWTL